MTTLGERLLILRRRRGLTQKELAQAAGLNTNTVSRLEQGDLHDLGGQSVAKLAQAAGIPQSTLARILGGERNATPPVARAVVRALDEWGARCARLARDIRQAQPRRTR